MLQFSYTWPVLAVFIGIVAWAVINDVRSFRIPNIACAALVLLYPAWLMLNWPATEPLLHIAQHVGVALAVLAGGFVLFLLRAFGAGDAKLLAAVALWAGPAEILNLVIVTTLAGGVLSLVVILSKALKARFGPAVFYLYMQASGALSRAVSRGTAGESTGRDATASPGPARGPRNMSLTRPIPYGVAIGAGAVIVAYGLLTTSGAA